MDGKSSWRSVWLGLFVASLAFVAFTQTAGAENVRAVQMVALIAAGMGLGVALVSFKLTRGKTRRE